MDVHFNELQRKSQFADDLETAKRICSGRGEWIIQENDSKDKNRVEQEPEDKDSEKDHPDLMPYVVDVSYDERLLLWHIATELLYNIETSDHVNKERLFSKILSDYMLYLLIVQPGMMTYVAGIGKIRYRDTCAEAERFIKRRSLGSKDLKAACEKILDVNTEVKPIKMKGDRSKSMLLDKLLYLLVVKERSKLCLFSTTHVGICYVSVSTCFERLQVQLMKLVIIIYIFLKAYTMHITISCYMHLHMLFF
ncbi:hypothetical protein K2173_002288 [Erythroxylum novogranatense]|uniref:Uncharacterized protein n=1 Tax=Erythroxylum novogranatense TaxID=1862640 RepID=A0AAV8T9L4_9ROSI|nr:hypothetical protein K2173_002288 [Erythroxylum novogranatense]